MSKFVLGIDQSITSSGVVIFKDNKLIDCKLLLSFNELVKHCVHTNISFTKTRAFKAGLLLVDGKLTKKRKDLTKDDKQLLKANHLDRLNSIAQQLSTTIKTLNIKKDDDVIVTFESVSFGSTGMTSTLGMLLGMLIQTISNEISQVQIKLVAPTSLKKFATGSGRADKDDMLNAVGGGQDLKFIKSFADNAKIEKIDDLVDAYHLARFGLILTVDDFLV